jgi:hypothetical protein
MNIPDPNPDSIALRWNNPDGSVEAISVGYDEFISKMTSRLEPCLKRLPPPLGKEAPSSLRGPGVDAFVRRLLLVVVGECCTDAEPDK